MQTPTHHASSCSTHQHAQHWQKKFFVGVVLIAVGFLSLFNYFGMFQIAKPWHYAPFIMVLIGLLQMVVFPSVKRFTNGMFLTFLGVWLYAVFEHWMGLTFSNSWPLILIAVGIRIIVESRLNFLFAKEHQNEE